MIKKFAINKGRQLSCIKADILFQVKHGFYYVYIIICVIYVVLLKLIPEQYALVALPFLLYSDPSALGLFFIGGMVLLEKQQGILSLLYISPIKVIEYMISKITTLALVSVLSAVAISIILGFQTNYILLVIGIVFSSCFYTLMGFIIVTKVGTVNEYIVKMLLPMIILFIPCVVMIPNSIVPLWLNYVVCFIPSVAGLKLVAGSFSNINSLELLISGITLVVVNGYLVRKVSTLFTQKVIINQ